jgi:hypothetical protein
MALAPDCSSRLPAPLLGSVVARFISGARLVQPTALANDRSIHHSSNHLYSGPRSLRRSVPPIMFILCSPQPLNCSNTSALGCSIPGCSSNQFFWPAQRGRRSLPLPLACSGVRQYCTRPVLVRQLRRPVHSGTLALPSLGCFARPLCPTRCSVLGHS